MESFVSLFSSPWWAKDSHAPLNAFCLFDNTKVPNGHSCWGLSTETDQDDREEYKQSGCLYKIHFSDDPDVMLMNAK